MAASIKALFSAGTSSANLLKISLRSLYTQSYREVRCSAALLHADQQQNFDEKNRTLGKFQKPSKLIGKITPLRSLIQENKLNIDSIDYEVKKKGRIYSQDVESIFNYVLDRKMDKENLSRYFLFLIRCCGNLMPDITPEKRTNLVHKMWNKFKTISDPHLDITHYNALLRVYNQNSHKFDQNIFLNEIAQRDLEANRVTYQCLIAHACKMGDIERATKLLATMQEKGMVLTESIFESLIIGHARAGDIDSSKGIPDIMRKFHLKPGLEIYTALMIAFAESGDLEGIMQTWNKISEEGFQSAKPVLPLIESLVDADRPELVPEILDTMKSGENSPLFSNLFPSDVANTIRTLLYRGHHQTAFLILSETPPNIFLPRMVFVATLFNSSIDDKCPEDKKWDYLNQITELFPELYEITLNKLVKAKFYPTLTSKIIDEIKTKNIEVENSVIHSVVKKCLFEDYPELATDLAKKWKFDDEKIKDYLSIHLKKFYHRNQNAAVVTEFIEALLRDKVDTKREMTILVNGFLDTMHRGAPSVQTNLNLNLRLFHIFNDKGFKINFTWHLLKKMKELSFSGLTKVLCKLIDPETLAVLIQNEKEGQKRTELQNHLVAVYCLNGDYNKAQELKEEIVSSGGNLYLFSNLTLFYAASVNGDVDAATELSSLFNKNDQKLYFMLIDAVEILARENRLEVAVELIGKLKSDYPILINEKGMSGIKVWPDCIFRLMNKGYTKEAEALVDVLVKEGYKATNFTYNTIIFSYIRRNDIESAIAYLEHTYKMYKLAPGFVHLIKEAMKVKDQNPVLLDRVLKCNIYSKMQLQTILGFAYLATGHLKEARNILKNVRFNSQFIRDEIEKTVDKDDHMGVHNLINATKFLIFADMDEIYFLAIKAYGKKNNWSKCLEMWNDMQGDDVLPRSRTLIYLAEILQANNQPVPFYVPVNKTV